MFATRRSAAYVAVGLAGALLVARAPARAQNPPQPAPPMAMPGMQPNPGMPGMGGGPGGMGMPGMPGMQPGMPGGMGMPGMQPGMGGGPGFQPGMGGPYGMQGMGPRPMTPVLTATPDYVYVLRGNTLYQFSAKDLKLLNKVMLEEEPAPMPFRPQGGAGRGVPGRPGVGGPAQPLKR